MSLGGGGGEIPKGGRAGRARSLGIWPGGEIPRDLVPGGKITGGAKSLGHRFEKEGPRRMATRGVWDKQNKRAFPIFAFSFVSKEK